jgi:hypothetical protein
VYRNDPGPAHARSLRHVAVAEPDDHPAQRGEGGVPAQVPLPVAQPSVEGSPVELHGDLQFRSCGVQAHGAVWEIDTVLEQRNG